MKELTRIVTIQLTIIAKGENVNTKEAAAEEVKNMFDFCDDVNVTVQDFIIDKE